MNLSKPILFTLIIGAFICSKQTVTATDSTAISENMTTEEKTAIDALSEDTTKTPTSKSKTKINHKPLTIIVTNLTSADAIVVVGLYGTKNKFPKPKGELKVYRFKPTSKELEATITDLKYGTYALAIYQDVNDNKKIDKNFIGIPTEAYAFSNNYKPTVKAPSFNDCKFIYNAKTNSVSMKMIQ